MQITEQLIERIARRVFNSMFAPALRQSNVQGGTSGSVRYAQEAAHAAAADTASAVPWSGISDKPSQIFAYKGGIENAYVSGTTYKTIDSGTYIRQLTGSTDSLVHFQADGSASGLDIRFSWTQDANNPLQYRKTVDSNRFAGAWVNIIDSNNIGNQSVNYATSAGNADTVDNEHASAFLHLTGGTMTGALNICTGVGISDSSGNGMLCYHPNSWTGVSATQWGVGAISCEGVIRSSSAALKHYRANDNVYEIIDAKGGQTIANSLQIASVKIEQTNEINSYTGNLHLNYRVATGVTACVGGGNFGIGVATPSYKLHVGGKIYCTGGFAFLSDIRRKNVIDRDFRIGINDIAKAPLIRYTLKDDPQKDIHIGSVAQYWQNIMPEAVNTAKDGTLSMDYSTISLVSAIILARKVETLEKELSAFKKLIS